MRILYLEPFHGGSHQRFGEQLQAGIAAEWESLTLPARHWKWRMRGAALWFASAHAELLRGKFDLIVASSYLPLAELLGLVPALAPVPSLLYFHENQLSYPARKRSALQPGAAPAERDHHFGFTQLVSAAAATRCVFNSAYNQISFLSAAESLLRRMPDAQPTAWLEAIRLKSCVLGVPLELEALAPPPDPPLEERAAGPLILWNHRWEYDKGPDTCCELLAALAARGVPFRVAVCGQRFTEQPEALEPTRRLLGDRVEHWGTAAPQAYARLLRRASLVLSTARHEFFGISVIEAVHAGARPLLPNGLVYPELFPEEYLYRDFEHALSELERLARGFVDGSISLRADRRQHTQRFAAAELLPQFRALFAAVAGTLR